MRPAARIIKRLGGTRAAAVILDVPVSTVQSWKVAGVIPARRQSAVLAAAKAHGFELTHADFFEAA